MKQDFLAKSFPQPTLLAVEYSSGYLLFISYSTICFWIDWVCVHKYMKFKGLDSREITSLSKSKNVINIACHFHYHWKKTHAPHKTHFHATWIIERLDRKLADMIGSPIWWKNVTSHYLEPFNLLHPIFCTWYFSSHISLSLSSTD